jgi:hypothetical protein
MMGEREPGGPIPDNGGNANRAAAAGNPNRAATAGNVTHAAAGRQSMPPGVPDLPDRDYGDFREERGDEQIGRARDERADDRIAADDQVLCGGRQLPDNEILSAPEHRPPAAPAAARATPASPAAPSTSAAATSASPTATPATSEQLEPLFASNLAVDYRGRWAAVQASFVDDPREAVRHGDELVAQVLKNLMESFTDERDKLEDQLSQTGDASTETLRVALRRYRSLFERLLSL